MNAQELINELKAQGITLQWDGARINWEAPFDFVPSDEIAKLVKNNWNEIIKRIDGPPPEWLLSGTNIVRLTQGDCLGAMGMYPDNLVDLIVTDPPYGYQFMGKDWDKAVPSVEIWKGCLRVLKPGGFAFIMSAPRQDVLARMIVNLEEAGFKTGFTSLYWTFARGFPKAQNIGKAVDKKAGVKRKVSDEHPLTKSGFFDKVDEKGRRYHQSDNQGYKLYEYNGITEPATPEAKALNGSYAGYQPKPAVEVILIAQKPLSEKTFVDQALSNRKGITWLDDCRIPYVDGSLPSAGDRTCNFGEQQTIPGGKSDIGWQANKSGRFPANLIDSDNILDEACTHAKGYSRMFSLDAWGNQQIAEGLNISDLEELDQNVLPFLIVKKPSAREKNFGCENLTPRQIDNSRNDPNAIECKNSRNRGGKQEKNFHPTVKPALLMSYLITLGSREGDIVLDPFCGSGTTCLAARLLKRPCIGIEKDQGYIEIAAARMRALNFLSHPRQEPPKKTETKAKSKSSEPEKKTNTRKTVIFHDKPGIALTKQTKIDSHNFPFTLNTGIGCHFGCRYCYLQGYPFNRHTEFPIEAKVKLWIADKLDKELEKYQQLPQHLKRVQVNVAAEGYLPLVMAKVKKEFKRDIMAEVLQVFRKHWESGNHWMVHLITKSHLVLKHLDIISAMRDQVQLELTITTLDEDRRREMEGLAPSVAKRLQVIRKFSSAGVFVRAMCMPLIGDQEDAESIKAACFENGARAFKHKGVNYWDEKALLNGETTKTSGRHDDVFEDLLVNSCEPYRINGEIQKMIVKMPVILKSGKTKRWKGYKVTDLEDREMTMEVSGYSEINDIDWGYVK